MLLISISVHIMLVRFYLLFNFFSVFFSFTFQDFFHRVKLKINGLLRLFVKKSSLLTRKIAILNVYCFEHSYKFNQQTCRGLDMSEHMLEKPDKPIWYDLFAVVNHHGSILGGHYTSYVSSSDGLFSFIIHILLF